MWLIFILAGIVLVLIARRLSRSKNNPSLKEPEIERSRPIEGGHYLGGLPGVAKSYYFIKFLPTQEGFDLYSTVENQFIKFASVLKSEIESITVEDKSFAVKKFNPAMLPLLGVVGAVAFKRNKKYDVAIMTMKINRDSLLHESMFSFEQKGSTDESLELANKTREQLIIHLKLVMN